LNFTHAANELGDPRAANMVMLGALLEISGALPQVSIDEALRRLVKSERWYQLDERALARGRELYRESRNHPSDQDLSPGTPKEVAV
jgi:Pyruvate/2-oxoacid:ferredoxin oxidoreductase gamma subunit